MNRAEFLQPGGFPLNTNTLNFIQDSFTLLQELVGLAGDRTIVRGCIQTGSNVSDGVIILNGELLPFKGGALSTSVVVVEEKEEKTFEDGISREIYKNRFMRFGSGGNSIPWSDFVRLKDLKTFRQLPHQVSSAINEDKADQLATSRALKLLNDKIGGLSIVPTGVVVMWSGALNNIPEGFALCDGQNGTPNLRNRFIVGAGDEYSVGITGGAKEVELNTSQIPAHTHLIMANAIATNDTVSSGTQMAKTRTGGGRSDANLGGVSNPALVGKSSSVGGGDPHENRPPYYSLAFIIKL
jgi:microcystin-dependent protein